MKNMRWQWKLLIGTVLAVLTTTVMFWREKSVITLENGTALQYGDTYTYVDKGEGLASAGSKISSKKFPSMDSSCTHERFWNIFCLI